MHVHAQVHVRDATDDNAGFCRDMIWLALLASPSFVAKMTAPVLEKLEADYWQRWLSTPPAERDPVFVAVDSEVDDGNNNVGALVLKVDARDDAGHVVRWRFGIGVAAAARGRGVGAALIRRAIDVARERNAHEVALLVDPGNAPGLALYNKLGFVDVGEREGVREMRIAIGARTT